MTSWLLTMIELIPYKNQDTFDDFPKPPWLRLVKPIRLLWVHRFSFMISHESWICFHNHEISTWRVLMNHTCKTMACKPGKHSLSLRRNFQKIF